MPSKSFSQDDRKRSLTSKVSSNTSTEDKRKRNQVDKIQTIIRSAYSRFIYRIYRQGFLTDIFLCFKSWLVFSCIYLLCNFFSLSPYLACLNPRKFREQNTNFNRKFLHSVHPMLLKMTRINLFIK